MPGWLVLNLYSLTIAFLMLIYSKKDGIKTLNGSDAFVKMNALLCFLLVIDTISHYESSTFFGILIQRIGGFSVYAFDPLLGCFILLYINSWVTELNKAQKFLTILLNVTFIVNFAICTVSEVFNLGLFYYISEEGKYCRGPLYIPRVAVIFSVLLLTQIIVLISYRKVLNVKYRRLLMLIPILPILFGILQTLVKGYTFTYAGITLVYAIILVNIQCKNNVEDYLTGVLNRRSFDTLLDNKIKKSKASNKLFSMYMIDLDYFKKINDEFGHDAGDEALINIGKIIKKSIGKDDIICRFGGDEFVVMTDTVDLDECEKITKNIEKNIRNFNRKNSTYKLKASIGYSIYKPGQSKKAFLKEVDEKMYKIKSIHHAETEN